MRALGDLRRKPAPEPKKEEATAPKTEQTAETNQTPDPSFDQSIVIS